MKKMTFNRYQMQISPISSLGLLLLVRVSCCKLKFQKLKTSSQHCFTFCRDLRWHFPFDNNNNNKKNNTLRVSTLKCIFATLPNDYENFIIVFCNHRLKKLLLFANLMVFNFRKSFAPFIIRLETVSKIRLFGIKLNWKVNLRLQSICVCGWCKVQCITFDRIYFHSASHLCAYICYSNCNMRRLNRSILLSN